MKISENVVHEFAPNGKHRLVCGQTVGEFVGYTMPAVLSINKTVLMGLTDYWQGSAPFEDVNVIYIIGKLDQ